MHQAGVGDLGSSQGKDFEIVQSFQLLQAGVGDLGFVKPQKNGSSGELVGEIVGMRIGFFEAWRAKAMSCCGRRKRKRSCHENTTGPAVIASAHLAIPCWVAPLQSPTPFHQVSVSIKDER